MRDYSVTRKEAAAIIRKAGKHVAVWPGSEPVAICEGPQTPMEVGELARKKITELETEFQALNNRAEKVQQDLAAWLKIRDSVNNGYPPDGLGE
jgi:hypothetical protein